jgi:hypothetical protein
MGRFGKLFPGQKLKHDGGQDGVSRKYDPGGPLNLDQGVVFLAPPKRDDDRRDGDGAADDTEAAGPEQG